MKAKIDDFKKLVEARLENLPIVLIHGTNNSYINKKCREGVELISGPDGVAEMRVNKVTEGDLIEEPGKLLTLLKSATFFSGRQTLVVSDVTDKLTKTLVRSIKQWTNQDATIFLIAGSLKASSNIRKFIDPDPRFLSFPVYQDAQILSEINSLIEASSLKFKDPEVLLFLKNQNNFSSLSNFQDFIEKLDLLKLNDDSPVSFDDVNLLIEKFSDYDDTELLNNLAMGEFKKMLVVLRSLFNKGIRPNQIIFSTTRHFNLLYKLSFDSSKFNEILNSSFPPIFGARRVQIMKQVKVWNTQRLERVNYILMEADSNIRSTVKVSHEAVIERSFLRVCSLIKIIS